MVLKEHEAICNFPSSCAPIHCLCACTSRPALLHSPLLLIVVVYCSVAKSCPTLCDCSTPGSLVYHQLPVCSNSCPKSFISYRDPLRHMFTSILFYKNRGTGKLRKLLWVHQLEGSGFRLRLGQFGFWTYSWTVTCDALLPVKPLGRPEDWEWSVEKWRQGSDALGLMTVSGRRSLALPSPTHSPQGASRGFKGLQGLKDEGPLHPRLKGRLSEQTSHSYLGVNLMGTKSLR